MADAPNSEDGHAGNGILIDNSDGGAAVAATVITNYGLIQGKNGVGIQIVGSFADTITNNAGGIDSRHRNGGDDSDGRRRGHSAQSRHHPERRQCGLTSATVTTSS